MSAADLESDHITLGPPSREWDGKFNKQIAREDEVSGGGHHRAEVLGLGRAQGDRLLHLREPVEQAPVVEDQAAAHREPSGPARVDVRVQASRTVGGEHERPGPTALEV